MADDLENQNNEEIEKKRNPTLGGKKTLKTEGRKAVQDPSPEESRVLTRLKRERSRLYQRLGGDQNKKEARVAMPHSSAGGWRKGLPNEKEVILRRIIGAQRIRDYLDRSSLSTRTQKFKREEV